MRYVLAFVFCTVWAMPCFASMCQDMQDSVGAAVQDRNQRTANVYNDMIPDPESQRGMLSSCLDSVNSIGDAFTLGISVPGMDQMLESMCSQVDSMIQQKINQTHNEVLNSVNGLGGNNVFRVYGTGGDHVVRLRDRLQ